MKKGLLVLAASLLLASIVSSCKVIDSCPAYNDGSQNSSAYEQLD